MPWCDECDRYLNPNTMRDDGTCPSCGSRLASPRQVRRSRRGRGASADARAVRADQAAARASTDLRGTTEPPATTPWHFKVLLVALVVYLGWRLVQGIVWVVHTL